jgi:hypothetical protein
MLPRRHAGWFLALLLCAPTTAHSAQGLNLMWSQCFGEGLGTQNRSFACASNTGTNVIVGSFVLQNDMSNVIGTEIIMNLASDSPSLPDWWKFRNAGSCRPNAMAANFLANPADVVCVDWTAGLSVGGVGAYCVSTNQCVGAPSAPDVAIVKMIHAVAPTDATFLGGGVEYYDFTLTINNTKTVGTGSCAGCNVPVCIVLNSINVVARDNVEQRFLSTPTVPGSNFITWQGGGSPSTPQGIGCPAATPTRRTTWGSVKSLYR